MPRIIARRVVASSRASFLRLMPMFAPRNVNHLRIELASHIAEHEQLRNKDYGRTETKQGGRPQVPGQEERIAKYAAIIESGGRLFEKTSPGSAAETGSTEHDAARRF